MRLGPVLAAVGVAATLMSGCANPFGRQYEYEEQYYLDTTGTVSVVLDASISALVALRGMGLDPASSGIDRAALRKVFEDAGCTVTGVAQPWRRNGRRFMQVSLQANSLQELSRCAPLSWSKFWGLQPENDPEYGPIIHYRQLVGAAAGAETAGANWDGSEIVAIKLHLPSRIRYQNARVLEDGTTRDVERGNIVTWEQRLTDRLAGKPIDIDVKMDSESILFTTLWLFAGAFAAAAMAMVSVIWWVVRKGKRQRQLPPPASFKS